VLTSVAAVATWIGLIIGGHPAALPTLTRSEAVHDLFDALRTSVYRHHFDRLWGS
jgi:hypothetical protein